VRILLVDDDSDSLRVYGAMLASEGHEVTRASSGVDAIDELSRNPRCDVVITDFEMPGIKGDTTLSLIRARWPRLPVVLISNHDGLDERARDIGAAAYLRKPCSQPTLVRTLARLSRK
jgi:two-component system response regulator MprA